MDPPRPQIPNSEHSEAALNSSLEGAERQPVIGQYTGSIYTPQVEAIGVRQEGVPFIEVQHVTPHAAVLSRRKATVVSIVVTLTITLLTALSILLLARHNPPAASDNQLSKPQDITLKNAAASELPDGLQLADNALVVNGDIISRGNLQIANGGFVTIIKTDNQTDNQTFTLPNTSGTLCLDSNNCGYATTGQFNQLQQLVGQAAIGDHVVSLNGQTNTLNIQGTANRISVASGGGLITLSTPQDLAVASSPSFASLALSANLSVTGSITTPLNCTSFTNGGVLTTNGSGQIVCDNDDGGAGSSISGSGTANRLTMYNGANTITDSWLFQSGSTLQLDSTRNLSLLGGNLSIDSAAGQLKILESVGGTFYGSLDVGDLTSNQTYNFPDASGTVCLTSGNCVGVGGSGDILNNGQNGPVTIGTNNATDLTLETSNTPRFTVLSGGNVGIGDASPASLLTVGASDAFQVNSLGAIMAATGLTSSGAVTFSGLNSVGVVHTNGSGTLSTGAVALGSETTGNYVANIGSVTGLTLGGTAGAGGVPTLAVNYGSAANTAVQGNVALTCPSGTGNLSGGGTVITLGTGGTCAALNTVAAPNFGGTVTATGFSGDGSSLTSLNATQLTSGTVASARISGSYTGITGLGTITVGTWNGTALDDAHVSDTLTSSIFKGSGSSTDAVDLGTAEVAGVLLDANVSDTLTIGSSSTIDWTALSNYPAACSAGNAITALGDSVTCSPFATGGGVTSLSAIGSVPNANGATITGTVLNLQPADASFGGVVTTGIQTFAGAKTFNGQIIAGAGIDLGSQTLQGTTAVINFTNFDVDAVGAVTATSFTGAGSALTSLNATQLTSGTVASGRISGSYTGITGVGTITVGVWNGTALTDANVSDTLTSSIFKGTGTSTDAIDLGTAEVAGVLGDSNVSDSITIGASGSVNDSALSANVTKLGATLTKDEITNSGILGFSWADSEISDTLTASSFIGSGSATNAVDLGSAEVAGILADSNVSDTLTIGSGGSIDWTALTNYPTACSAGNAVTAVGDILTCGSFATGSGVAFLQGGNNFGGTTAGRLGTNNNGVLNFRTNNTDKLTLDTSGNLQFLQASTISSSTGHLTVQGADKLYLSSASGGSAGIILNDFVDSFVEVRQTANTNATPGLRADSNWFNIIGSFYDPTRTVSGGSAPGELQYELNQRVVTEGYSNRQGSALFQVALTNLYDPLPVNQLLRQSTPIRVILDDSSSLGNLSLVDDQVVIEHPGTVGIRPVDLSTNREFFNVLIQGNSNARYRNQLLTNGDVTFAIGDGSTSPTETMRFLENGDISLDSTTLFVDTSANNVGIGTGSPNASYKLTVVNAGAAALFQSTGANNSVVAIDNVAGSNQSIINFNDAGTTKFQLGKQTDNSFLLYDNANSRSALQVTGGNVVLNATAGNVGVGDSSPSYLLTVGNGDLFGVNSSGNVIVTSLGTANTSTTLCRNGSNQIATCLGGGGGGDVLQNGNSFGTTTTLGTNDSHDLAFETGGTTHWLINTSGHLLPNLNDTYDIGSDTNRVRDLYLGGNTIHIGNSTSDEYTIGYDSTTLGLKLKPTADSDKSFLIQNAGGTDVLALDTTYGRLSVTAPTNTNAEQLSQAPPNNAFDDPTYWACDADWGFDSQNLAHIDNGGSGDSVCEATDPDSMTVTPGVTYQVTFTLSGGTGGVMYGSIGNNAPSLLNNFDKLFIALGSNGDHSYTFIITAIDTTPLTFVASNTGGVLGNFDAVISNVSVKVYTPSLAPSGFAINDSAGIPSLVVTAGPSAYQGNTFIGGAYTFLGSATPGSSNTSGTFNTGIGTNTLVSNTTGSLNTALGVSALSQNTTGSNNTALGSYALQSNSISSNNTAVGYSAGSFVAGSNNTFLGYQAGNTDGIFSSSSSITNSTAIGYLAQVQASSSLVLGGQGANQVSVGIGTTVPTNTLSVSPAQYNTGTICQGSSSCTVASTTITGAGTIFTKSMIGNQVVYTDGTADTIVDVTDATHLTVGTSRVHASSSYRIHYAALQVSALGRVGIGDLTPDFQLDVEGELIANSGTTNLLVNNGLFVAPLSAPGATTSYTATRSLTVGDGANLNSNTILYGGQGIVTNNNSGTPLLAYGYNGTVQSASTGGISAGYGIGGSVSASNGTILTAAGLRASGNSTSGSGAITDSYGLYVDNQGGAGITNATGLYVQTQSGASGNNYTAIFQGGNVGIGTTGPTRTLDVSGNWGGNVENQSLTNPGVGTTNVTNKALAYYLSVNDTTGACDNRTFNITGVAATEGSYAYISSRYIDGGCSSGTGLLQIQINSVNLSSVACANCGATTVENYMMMYINGGWKVFGGASTADQPGGFDLGEAFRMAPGEGLVPGELVSFGNTDINGESQASRSTGAYDNKLFGIVSTRPGYVLDDNEDYEKAVIALAGRVPTLVNEENGPIAVGDAITASSIPGVGMKATNPGQIVGYAMAASAGPNSIITVKLAPGFWAPSVSGILQAQQASFDTAQITGTLTAGSLNVSGPATLSALTVTGNVTVQGTLTVAGNVEVANLYVNGKLISKGALPQITAGSALQAVLGASVSVNGTDTAGTTELTIGAAAPTGGELANIVFSSSYSTAPKIVISGNNKKSAKLGAYVVRTPNGFKIMSDDPLEANTTYSFDYIIIEAQNP